MANEKRLIDANALSESVSGIGKDIKRPRAVELACLCLIAEAPTVDAVEVVHGEWEITEDDYYDLVEMKCSVCGESYGFEDYEDDIPKNYHYCPNCGANMDLKGE